MSFRFKSSMRLKKQFHTTLDSKFLKELVGLKRTIKNGNKVTLDYEFLKKLEGEKAVIKVREDIDETEEFQVVIKIQEKDKNDYFERLITVNEIVLDSISEDGLEALGLEQR